MAFFKAAMTGEIPEGKGKEVTVGGKTLRDGDWISINGYTGEVFAGQVATKAGLARPTVSTTLSKLTKSGQIKKAERGYRLASTT